MPDVRSRVAAIELLLREGLGRPPQAEEAASPRQPGTAEGIEKLGWADMQMIFATQFASEIAAVTKTEMHCSTSESLRSTMISGSYCARRWTR